MFETVSNKSDHLLAKQPQNITQFIQSHPYQYLNELNSTFDYYDKTNANNKCYSTASRVKLPWKQFKIVKIPDCFKETFLQEKRQSNFLNTNDQKQHNQTQKRFWKQHDEILKRYSNKKWIPKSSFPLANSRLSKQNNKQLVDRLVSQNKNNLFLKKIIEKGANLNYNEGDIEQQVLNKLSMIRKNHSVRAKTAGHSRARPQSKNSLKKRNQIISQVKNSQKGSITLKLQPAIQAHQNEFLQYERKSEMINDYQFRIKQIDCSISQNNIKKAVALIKEMQSIIQN